MTPDVNVLIAAFREDHPQHLPARHWLTATLASGTSGGTFELLPMVAVGFLRVVTNKRTFASATPTAHAIAFLDSLLSAPNAWMPVIGSEWNLLEALCLERRLHGGIISDAWIAAAVRTNGLHLVTFDADFRQLLRPDQFTLLLAKPNLQERGARYLVRRSRASIDRRAA